MQALSIQLEQIAPVQKQDNQFIAQGRDNNVQVESTFQKQLEQAQKEQDVQNRTDDTVNHEVNTGEEQLKSSVNQESTQSRNNSVNANDEKLAKKIDNAELTNNSKKTSRIAENQLSKTSDINFSKMEKISDTKLEAASNAKNLLNNLKVSESNENLDDTLISDTLSDKNLSKNQLLQSADTLLSENEKTVKSNLDIKSQIKTNKEKSSDDALLLLLSGKNYSVSSNNNLASQMALKDSNNIEVTGSNEKSKSSKSNKAVLNVIDERTVVDTKNNNASIKTNNVDSNGTAEMSFSLSSQSSGELLTEDVSSGTKDTSRFQSMLSDQIQSNASEFVKNGSIILRDNNSGTINLILHPEELGNVKISLKLSDKLIAAQITVASEEAYNAFKSSIDALKSAFAAGGFETGGFDLSWSGQNQEQGQKNNDTNVYAALYEGRLPDADVDAQSVIASNNVNSYHSSAYSMQAVNVVI